MTGLLGIVHHFPQRIEHVCRERGLGEVLVRTHGLRQFPVVGRRVGAGVDDDWHGMEPLALPNLVAEAEAIHVRHEDGVIWFITSPAA